MSTQDTPVPVILATDIGSDVDDTWALAQLLRTEALDLRMVVTETGEARYRGAVAAKLLERAGRTDVPIALGLDAGAMGDDDRHQGPWIDAYELDTYPGDIIEHGIAAVREALTEGVTVVSIGPTPSLAAVLEDDPAIAAGCRFVGMHGSFEVGYGGSPAPDAETNVRVDPDALRTVLAAPWEDILLTPLDTCGLVDLDGDRYHRLWCATDDPLIRGVIENTCIFASRVPWMTYDDFSRRSSTLFDSVAVYLAHDESLVETTDVCFDVTDDGYTEATDDGPFRARAALEWVDQDGLEAHLTEVLLGGEQSIQG